LWNLKKAIPDPKREFSALSGTVFRNTWREVFFRVRVRVRRRRDSANTVATGLGPRDEAPGT
jgi:hypothetical protein